MELWARWLKFLDAKTIDHDAKTKKRQRRQLFAAIIMQHTYAEKFFGIGSQVGDLQI